jgi:hypothetical protein
MMLAIRWIVSDMASELEKFSVANLAGGRCDPG